MFVNKKVVPLELRKMVIAFGLRVKGSTPWLMSSVPTTSWAWLPPTPAGILHDKSVSCRTAEASESPSTSSRQATRHVTLISWMCQNSRYYHSQYAKCDKSIFGMARNCSVVFIRIEMNAVLSCLVTRLFPSQLRLQDLPFRVRLHAPIRL